MSHNASVRRGACFSLPRRAELALAGLSIANTRAGETPQMLTVKYLLEVAGFVLMAAAAAILVHDLFRLYQQSNLILNDQPRPAVIEPRYRAAGRFTALGLVCLLAGLSLQVVPAGMAGGGVGQILGTPAGKVYS